MNFIIKKFNHRYNQEAKDLILRILEGEFSHYDIERPDLNDISNYYQVDKGNFWIALDKDRLVGTVGLKEYDGIAYIKRMIVHKGYRGKGLAQSLLHTLIEYSQKQGFLEIYLSTSENLIAANKFYQKEGFIVISELPKQIPEQIATIHYLKRI